MTRGEKIGVFIYIFFLFFGPKIGTYIDTSIIASLVMILMMTIKHNFSIYLEHYTRGLLIFITIIIFYSLGISLINGFFDITYYGRMIRSVFSILGISLFFFDNDKIIPDEINNIIIFVLLIHAIIVLISSTVYIDLQYMLRGFNGFNKTIRKFRSTGLMMGFDMSGLLCNLGLVLTICKKRFSIVLFLLFGLATLFTSRFSIVFLVILTSIYIVVNFHNANTKGRKILLLGIGIPIALFGIVLLIITTNRFMSSEIANAFPGIYNLAQKVNTAYKTTDIVDLAESRHFAINPNAFYALFGTGIYGGADPGYTRYINCVGIIGLAMVICWHIFALRQIIKLEMINNRNQYIKKLIISSIIMILLVLNFKNCYFFTGTFFEFMLIQLYLYRYEWVLPGLSTEDI